MGINRPTVAEINLNSLAYNLNQVRKLVGHNRKILPVIKANAYGHGAIHVAQNLISEGAEMLGVAILEEGIELRNNGIDKPILIMGGVIDYQAEEVVRYDLTPVVYNQIIIEKLNKISLKEGKTIKIHVKIDTGMGRLGVTTGDAIEFIKGILKYKNIIIEGIMSHFSDADLEDKGYAEFQLRRFKEIISKLEMDGINIPIHHLANSAGVIGFEPSYFDMVRPGLMLYGYHPSSEMKELIDLQMVLSLKTRIIHLKRVPAETFISYGRTFRTKRESLIATLPIGYADGFNRLLSNNGEVIVRGKRVPVIGRVCMDNTMIDVTDIKEIKIGDEVILIGNDSGDSITAWDIANRINTIPYEVLCNISSRVPRIYKKL